MCVLDGVCSSSCPSHTWGFEGGSKICVCMPKSCDTSKPFLLETTNGTQCVEKCDDSLFVDPTTMNCVDYCQTRSFVKIAGVRYCEPRGTLAYYTDDDSDSAQQFAYCPPEHQFADPRTSTCVSKCSTGTFYANGRTLSLVCAQKNCSVDETQLLAVDLQAGTMCAADCPENVGYVENGTCRPRCVTSPFYSAEERVKTCSESCPDDGCAIADENGQLRCQ